MSRSSRNRRASTKREVPRTTRDLQREARWENDRQFDDLFLRHTNVFMNQFVWNNLPETVDPIFFERTALFDSRVCLLYVPQTNAWISLPCTPASHQNKYYDYTTYRAFSINFEQEFLALTRFNKDILAFLTSDYPINNGLPIGVVLNDNFNNYPMVETVEIYCKKILNTQRAIDVATEQLKIPSIIQSSEDTINSIQKAVSQIRENVVAVFANSSLKDKLTDVKSIPTGANPDVLQALWDTNNNYKGELYTAFGCDNLNTADKKERLLTDEVNSNNEIIEAMLETRLDSRKEFCKNFNEVFRGYPGFKELSVELKHPKPDKVEEKEVDGNANSES